MTTFSIGLTGNLPLLPRGSGAAGPPPSSFQHNGRQVLSPMILSSMIALRQHPWLTGTAARGGQAIWLFSVTQGELSFALRRVRNREVGPVFNFTGTTGAMRGALSSLWGFGAPEHLRSGEFPSLQVGAYVGLVRFPFRSRWRYAVFQAFAAWRWLGVSGPVMYWESTANPLRRLLIGTLFVCHPALSNFSYSCRRSNA